jgi:hypothetical protein
MALRISCSGAVKHNLLFERSEFKLCQRNEMKFSQFVHSLDFLVLLDQAKRTFKKNNYTS